VNLDDLVEDAMNLRTRLATATSELESLAADLQANVDRLRDLAETLQIQEEEENHQSTE
jgi:hypothetical protein